MIFVFGSILTSATPKDIDILLLYAHAEDRSVSAALRFRHLAQSNASPELGQELDIVLLSYDEEAELNFVETESAKRLML